MTGPVTGVGGGVAHELSAFALSEHADRAHAARLTADPTGLGRDLLEGVQAASENYRRSLVLALDPGVGFVTASNGGVSPRALGAAGAFPAAPAPNGVFTAASAPFPQSAAPATAPAPTPAPNQAVGGGSEASVLPQTEAATQTSLALLMAAHQQIMKRQIGVMSATTTLDAASSGARRSTQNIDTLLRGQ